MSWNGTSTNPPNWAGQDQAQVEEAVGDLYIVPDPPTITENPSIGLQERNEVPLPTAYKDFSVDDLNAVSINNNPNFDASNWSLYRAISDVQGTLGVFSVPLYSISDFLNITATNNITAQAGNITAGINVDAGVRVAAPLGSFTAVNAESVQVSVTNETAAVDIYGANLVAGNNALYVEGGTTLTGGGVIHGVTIGALQVAGADTNRIDVVPIGIDITTLATPISIASGVACSVAAGAVLSLAGGSYIQYNSDQHYFINTTSGNDFTDIYVGNIHAADGGSAPLRINDAGRGVELANVNSMTMTTQLAGVLDWNDIQFYSIGNKVRVAGFIPAYYNALVYNRDTFPTIPIPDWVSGQAYEVNVIVFSAGLVYRCTNYISSSTPPDPLGDPNWESLGFTTNAISNIWQVYSPSVANITGDDVSNITIGTITAPVDYVRLAGDGLIGTTGLQEIGGIKKLTLTTTIFSAWNVATDYADGAEVEYDNLHWVSQINGNIGNIPSATLQDWESGEPYITGNVRYDTTDTNAYICTSPRTSTTPPSGDPFYWTFFQLGNNGEDVWFPFTPPVVSSIEGDRASNLTIGTISCVGDVGSYLEISANPENNADAIIISSGGLAFGGTALQMVALTGDVNIASAEGEAQISGKTGVILASDEGNVEFAAPVGQANISCALTNNIISTGADISLNAFTNVNITAGAGSKVLVNSTLDFNNNDVIDARTITGAGALTLATTGATNLNLSPDTGGLIVANKNLNLSSNNIINANTITGAGALTLATTGATNLNLSPATGGVIVANKNLNLSSNNIINANTITGAGALTLATTGATNLNLSPDTGGVIVANKNLSMGGNPITNCTSVGNNGVITIASTTNSIFISPSTSSGSGVVQISKNLDMATINAITNCIGLSSANALSFTANNGAVNLTATGAGNRILLNSDASMGNRTLYNFTGTNVGGIYGLTTQPLVLAGQQATPAVRCGGTLAMWQDGTTQGAGNSITGITTLNGRNIFSYGNFYNTATQTLGAINTATRVVMNTSANNNLITLDSVTNIGRITFTNAGVYNVVWNAYLFHGSGGTAKSCIWIRLNGTDVAGSGKTENNDNQQNETNLTSSSLINATAGQYIEFFWASDSVNVPLTAVAASSPFPLTPSFSCTINIVG
jgi:hypothetical protein